MEGQNKRDHIDIECASCGSVFPVAPEEEGRYLEFGQLTGKLCSDCREEDEWR